MLNNDNQGIFTNTGRNFAQCHNSLEHENVIANRLLVQQAFLIAHFLKAMLL